MALRKIAVETIVLGATLMFAAVAAPAQSVAPDAAAKAKALKTADSQYVRALCDGTKSERSEALAARSRARDDLEKAITDSASGAPDVQKALDAAAAAGDAANKIAVDPGASDHDKSDAQDKFVKAKADLRDALAKERAGIETRIGHDFDIKLDAPADCPDRPKAAERHKGGSAKSPRAAGDAPRRVREQNESASGGGTVPVSVGIGGGGMSIGIGGGGVGISIGH